MPDNPKPKRLPAAEFLQRIQDTASHFGDLSDEQRQQYVDEHMKRAGYKPTTTWGDPEESGDSGGSGGGWFPK